MNTLLNHLNGGYKYAYATVILWAMYNVIAKVGVIFNVHPAIFVAIGMMVSATALLIYSGAGRLSLDSLKDPYTMGYSFLNLLEHVFTLNLFMYVASSEGSLMQRMNVAFAVLIAWFMGRKQCANGLMGLLLVQAGVIGFISHIDPAVKAQAIAWLIVVVLCQTIKTFVSETHPVSNNAKDYKEHARVTGFVTFVAAITFFGCLIVASIFKDVGAITGGLADALPSISDFFHPATFIMALIFGVLNDAPAGYCYFYATKRVKSENFFAIAALIPLVTYGLEWCLSKFGILELKIFTSMEWGFIGLILCGSVVMALNQVKPKPKVDDLLCQRIVRTKDRLEEALAHFDGNLNEASVAMEMRKNDYMDILEGKREPTPEEMDIIRENSENNISARDAVTGLDNKRLFMTQMSKLERKDIPFTLLFIDLNKFKPINDTHGHAVGDKVLKTIAGRLEANYAHVAAISRLGGDEFCMMFFEYVKEEIEDLVAEVKAVISQPIFYDEVGEVLNVGCAAGVASYPTDGSTGKELLKLADEFMYEDKGDKAR